MGNQADCSSGGQTNCWLVAGQAGQATSLHFSTPFATAKPEFRREKSACRLGKRAPFWSRSPLAFTHRATGGRAAVSGEPRLRGRNRGTHARLGSQLLPSVGLRLMTIQSRPGPVEYVPLRGGYQQAQLAAESHDLESHFRRFAPAPRFAEDVRQSIDCIGGGLPQCVEAVADFASCRSTA